MCPVNAIHLACSYYYVSGPCSSSASIRLYEGVIEALATLTDLRDLAHLQLARKVAVENLQPTKRKKKSFEDTHRVMTLI
jgi:hypothetical protein